MLRLLASADEVVRRGPLPLRADSSSAAGAAARATRRRSWSCLLPAPDHGPGRSRCRASTPRRCSTFATSAARPCRTSGRSSCSATRATPASRSSRSAAPSAPPRSAGSAPRRSGSIASSSGSASASTGSPGCGGTERRPWSSYERAGRGPAGGRGADLGVAGRSSSTRPAVAEDFRLRWIHGTSPDPRRSVGRWRSELDEAVVERLRRDLGERMGELGYADWDA